MLGAKKWILAAVLNLGTFPGVAMAENSAADTVALDYFVQNAAIRDFIEELSLYSGARIQLSGEVRGRIVNQRLTGTLAEVLRTIADDATLDLFEFNGVYYVSSQAEATTRLTRLGDLTAEAAIDALKTSGLPIDAFSLSAAANGSAILISGPPKLLAFSESVIESIPPVTAAPAGPKQVILVRRGINVEATVINEPGAFPIASAAVDPEPDKTEAGDTE